jgi:hypothetical protein
VDGGRVCVQINEQGMVDFSEQKKAEMLVAEQKYLDDVAKLRLTYREYEQALETARRDGNLAAFAAELEKQRALEAQDLAGRQEMIDQYYTICKTLTAPPCRIWPKP